jgi:hypothetical protein
MRFRTEIVVATIEIMTVIVMVCLIVWIAIEMAMALPIAGTGARTTLVATNYLPLALMRSSPPDVVHLICAKQAYWTWILRYVQTWDRDIQAASR